MRNWLKTLLFISSFSPALLVAAAVRIIENKEVDTITTQLIVISIIGTSIPILILQWIKKEAEVIKFKAKKVESTDYFLIVFIASYLSPIAINMATPRIELLILIIIAIFITSWIITNIPSHPLLYIIKYKFYKVESDDGMVYMLITKKEIKTPKDILSIKKISNNMLMEHD